MTSYGSVPGISGLILLVRGKENEWMERIEMRLGRQQLWEIVSGEEKPPIFLKSNHTANLGHGTPTVNLAIDFEEIERESKNEENERTPGGGQHALFKLTMEAKEWKARHDKAYYFIKESLSATEYGLPKAKAMVMFRDNMAAAWQEITKSFNIGNLMLKKLVIRINHYRHFSIREGEDFESY